MKPLFLIGRILFGGFFIYSGINHLKNRSAMKQYVAAKNVPAPEAAVTGTGIAMLAAGTSVLLGIKPKYGAAALIAFLATVSPAMHDFWRSEDPGERSNNLAHFGKNLALLGAAVALMGVEEPWPAAVLTEKPGVIERVKDAAHALAA